MNKEEVMKLAREAGYMEVDPNQDPIDLLTRFAALVAAAERANWPEEMKVMERQVEILSDMVSTAEVAVAEAYRCGQEHGAVNGGPFNFCPRCGKRAYPDTIHTCTPPAFMG